MPKSKRTKAKHQDFQKVKLKVGKKLPRGLNETKATFKSTGLNIKEQFKGESGQSGSRKRLVISEILAHLQHYNAGMKHDALQNLKELINLDSTILLAHLPLILERLSQLFVEKDSVVRSTVLKMLKIIYPRIPADQLSPFFPLLSAHICCAMTHIQDDIRFDSLPLLDLCLEHYPALVISSTSQLLPNFIEQISQQSQSSKGSKSNERTLLVNPNSKLSSKKWRIQVLNRLSKFLMALSENRIKAGKYTESLDSCKHVVSIYVQAIGNPVCSAKESARNYSPSCGFSLRSAGLAAETGDDLLSDTAKFKSYFETIIPLLVECWVEAGPAQMNVGQKAGNVISGEALMTLQSVLGVLQLLILCVHQHMEENNVINMHWIKDTFMSDFVHYFMTYFPYSLSGRSSFGGKQGSKYDSLPVVSINLAVCDVMSYFWTDGDTKVTKSKWFGWIVSYVSQQLSGENPLNHLDLQCVIRILTKATSMTSQKETITQILEDAKELYQTKHPASSDALTMLAFFLKLVTNREKRSSLVDSPSVIWWMTHLPKHCLQIGAQNEPASLAIFEAMNILASQNEVHFLKSLEEHLGQLLDPAYMNGISESVQEKLVQLLYWVPMINKECILKLSVSCHEGGFSSVNITQLLQILQMRLEVNERGNMAAIGLSDYISLLLSVCAGYSKKELGTIPVVSEPSYNVVITENHRLKTLLNVVPMVCFILGQLMQTDDMWSIIGPYIEHLMVERNNLPFETVLGFMNVISRFYVHPESSQENFHVAIASWLYSLIEAYVTEKFSLDIQKSYDQQERNLNQKESLNGNHDIVSSTCRGCMERIVGCFEQFLSLILTRMNQLQADDDTQKRATLVLTWILNCLGAEETYSFYTLIKQCLDKVMDNTHQNRQLVASLKLAVTDIEIYKRNASS